jgi:hypothetical protein
VTQDTSKISALESCPFTQKQFYREYAAKTNQLRRRLPPPLDDHTNGLIERNQGSCSWIRLPLRPPNILGACR